MFAHRFPMAYLFVERDQSDVNVFTFFHHPLAQKKIS